MADAKTDPRYRLVVFDAIDEPEREPVRDLFRKVTGLHQADAMLWIAKTPGAWPHALSQSQTRALLDGLYDLGVAAEAWLVGKFPDLNPPRSVHDGACLPDGFRVTGLRGEPTHWAPWKTVEMICAGRIDASDEFRPGGPPGWPSVVATGLRALTLRKPRPAPRTDRASRIVRDPIGEVIIVRRDPRIAFRVVENQMNYAYLGEALRPSAAENFPKFLADLVARSDDAYLTPSTRALLYHGEAAEYLFPNSQALLDYATHRLLWSWYKRDRDKALDRDRGKDDTLAGD